MKISGSGPHCRTDQSPSVLGMLAVRLYREGSVWWSVSRSTTLAQTIISQFRILDGFAMKFSTDIHGTDIQIFMIHGHKRMKLNDFANPLTSPHICYFEWNTSTTRLLYGFSWNLMNTCMPPSGWIAKVYPLISHLAPLYFVFRPNS